jgi:hypothetical protein
MDAIGLIGNFLLVIGLMLLPLYIARQLVPGPYRLAERSMRRLGDFAIFRQAKRRGVFFAIFVHLFMIVGLSVILMGVFTGTYSALFPGLIYVVIAIISKRVYDAWRRSRSRNRSLPTWRR